jgi:hypothetical protein
MRKLCALKQQRLGLEPSGGFKQIPFKQQGLGKFDARAKYGIRWLFAENGIGKLFRSSDNVKRGNVGNLF